MMDWLQTPISGASDHTIAPWAYWHARIMVLGWAVLLPLGALLARFFKVTAWQNWPTELDSKFWWHGHRALQYGGVVVVSVGVALAWSNSGGATLSASLHGWLGWSLLAAAWVQVVASWLRGSKGGPTDQNLRGDHYDMTRKRLVFERLHKGLGWLAVMVAAGVVVSGLFLVDAPRWMLLALSAWWLAFAMAFVLLQKKGRAIDTYQAIWGPDSSHPGNCMAPTGWGVKRPLDKA